MVENRPWLNFFTHLLLILGVIVVVFPVYVAFVASTQTAVEVEQAPMSLLPGAHFIENYMQILTEGGGTASRAPVAVSYTHLDVYKRQALPAIPAQRLLTIEGSSCRRMPTGTLTTALRDVLAQVAMFMSWTP